MSTKQAVSLAQVVALPPDSIVRRDAWPADRYAVRLGEGSLVMCTVPPGIFGHDGSPLTIAIADAIASDWRVLERAPIRMVAAHETDLFMLHDGHAVPIQCDEPLPGRVVSLVILPERDPKLWRERLGQG